LAEAEDSDKGIRRKGDLYDAERKTSIMTGAKRRFLKKRERRESQAADCWGTVFA